MGFHSWTLAGMELGGSPDGHPSAQSLPTVPQAPGAMTPRTQIVVSSECCVKLCGIGLYLVATRRVQT